MVITDMKIFTIIKEHSERIPHKNFSDINGHPLWWHLLSELEGLDITVNTDSPKFIKQLQNSNLKSIAIIKRLQKHIDWENNENIDSSPVEDMLFDFCKTLDKSEIVVLTHVTSPFLKKETIFEAVDMLQKDPKSKSLHSVHLVQDFVWLKKNNETNPVNFSTDRVQQTQDLSPILISKGAFFIAKAGDILDQRKRLPEPLIFFPLDHVQSVEIDNFNDLEFAKLLKGE
jgi:CMP-N-acetylneuraminic acid synthetase